MVWCVNVAGLSLPQKLYSLDSKSLAKIDSSKYERALASTRISCKRMNLLVTLIVLTIVNHVNASCLKYGGLRIYRT